jgi:D-glycero-alpha-D-manno-heptose 1-phosphate guanylyltransferase
MNSSSNIREAIILAGGLGTRLRSVIPDLPKCMAPVAGKPFVSYVIDYFRRQGIEKFVFALGYKSEAFEDFLRAEFSAGTARSAAGAQAGGVNDGPSFPVTPPASYSLSVEKEPLGTGGAIRLACRQVSDKNVLVLNGDTFFRIDLAELADFHHRQAAHCTLCLKPMKNFDRYGVVELGPQQGILHFREKQFYQEGLINGGVYALDADRFRAEDLPEKFSFEKDWLEKFHDSRVMSGLIQDEYFIDIGIPEDYERAQKELPLALRAKKERR